MKQTETMCFRRTQHATAVVMAVVFILVFISEDILAHKARSLLLPLTTCSKL